MILADTSIWIDHFRTGDPHLAAELMRNGILMHPFIAGELALGFLPQRSRILKHIDSLPAARVAHPEEVRFLIEQQNLFNRGIGYIDAHLLASVLLTPHASLWTRDRRLKTIAFELRVTSVLN